MLHSIPNLVCSDGTQGHLKMVQAVLVNKGQEGEIGSNKRGAEVASIKFNQTMRALRERFLEAEDEALTPTLNPLNPNPNPNSHT